MLTHSFDVSLMYVSVTTINSGCPGGGRLHCHDATALPVVQCDVAMRPYNRSRPSWHIPEHNERGRTPHFLMRSVCGAPVLLQRT
jgi:hypothetical protein